MLSPTIGVLALQGDVREHLRALEAVGAEAVRCRRPEEIASVDALVLPGGESTTMAKLARTFGVFDLVRERIAAGMPVLGTCAGMILLAERVLDGAEGQETFGGLDVTVRRNAFGRQVDSFEGTVHLTGIEGAVPAVFIRAPWVEEVGAGVEVLARVEEQPDEGSGVGRSALGRIVAVRQGTVLATAFHPEMGGDPRVHGLFADMVRAALDRPGS
ncbi:MAG: pyridoxal 5'-phosphate synthase glutaminase subunit PdxT [Nocardioides sp.]|nr:pyridoxal 5'-phosphate synthase glutaminase subunit PdxT [Nocardioides sp.]